MDVSGKVRVPSRLPTYIGREPRELSPIGVLKTNPETFGSLPKPSSSTGGPSFGMLLVNAEVPEIPL